MIPRYIKKLFKKLSQGWVFIFGTGMCISLLMGFFYVVQPEFIKALDNKVYDTLVQSTYSHRTTGIPVIVDIDEKALAKFGQFPWPRYRVALLLASLREYGAMSAGLDILFAEPDRTSPISLQRSVKRDLLIDIGFTGIPAALMDNDEVLAGVLGSGPYVLGYFFNFEPVEIPREGCVLHTMRATVLKAKGTPPNVEQNLFVATEPVCNLPILSKNAHYSGFYNTDPDPDGIVRRTPMTIYYDGQYYPSLSLATLMEGFQIKQNVFKLNQEGAESMRFNPSANPMQVLTGLLHNEHFVKNFGGSDIQGILASGKVKTLKDLFEQLRDIHSPAASVVQFLMGQTIIPLDAKGQLLINWRGRGKTFEYISAADVLEKKLPKDALQGKIVFIGTSAAGLKDIRATPLDKIFPGVEAHATVVDNLLTNDIVSRPTWVPGFELIMIVVLGVLSTCSLTWAKAIWSLVPLVGIGFGMWFGAEWFFADKKVYISPFIPMLTLGTNFTVLTLLKFMREEGHKKFLHDTFQSYLSPELIENMIKSNEMPELGGEARVCTAYFTDIQGFSSFSEILTAHQLVELLNEYLSAMTDILIGDKGTLDKYEGDAIIAFFGAPLDVPDHALRACRVAVAMQHTLLDLRAKWAQEKVDPAAPSRNTKHLPPEQWAPDSKWPKLVHEMKMRIGINSGEIVVGNMGSSMRMNYTMMGDSVNLSARLEAAAKQYGVYTMMSDFTMELTLEGDDGVVRKIRDLVETRFLDNIQVVGKEEPVKVYELCALKGDLTEQEQKLFAIFNKGMAHYLATEWDEAMACFREAMPLERVPDGKTTPSEVFLKRCEMFKEHPPVEPGKTWDGVFRLTKK
ncbi:MAG: CHASE2 domain-containing protein [Desulfovibrionaceae bacterium]